MSEETVVGVLKSREPYAYGDPLTYRLGAEWLTPCDLVEDWGCGRGYLRYFIPASRYRGIDMGVDSVPQDNFFADERVELSTYQSWVPGIFMRHVIDHNYTWREILRNAVASCHQRLFLVVFTPLLPEDDPADASVIALHGPPEYPCYDPPVPNMSFSRRAIEAEFVGCRSVRYEFLETGTQYKQEHCWFVEK